MSCKRLQLGFSLIQPTVWEQMSFKDFQDGHHSWILEQNEFRNSKAPCHPNTSHQVWAQSNLPFGIRHGLKIFKMATVILDIRAEQFQQFRISMLLQCLPLSFSSIRLKVWEEMSFEDHQDGRTTAFLDIKIE